MRVVFELEEVPGGIFEKECVVLDSGAREPNARLLIERQPFPLGLLKKLLPRFFRQKSKPEMVRINTVLRWQGFRRQMRHELMPCESERDGVARLPTQRATKSINIETFCRHYVVYGKREVKEHALHGNCP
jgi:hypothetical protein